jgi:DNA-binding transcriptional LysR family regulator
MLSRELSQQAGQDILGDGCGGSKSELPGVVSAQRGDLVFSLNEERIRLPRVSQEHLASLRQSNTRSDAIELKSIPCSQVAAAPLLMRERGSGTRRVVEMALARQGVKANSLRIVMELDSTEAIKSAVEAGLGIGFVSRWAIAKDLRLDSSFRIVRVEGLRIQREFLLAYPNGPEPQGLVQEFRRFLFSRAGTHRSSVKTK